MMAYATTTVEDQAVEDQAFGNKFLEEILTWVADEYRPEDIFEEAALAKWAEENGWLEG